VQGAGDGLVVWWLGRERDGQSADLVGGERHGRDAAGGVSVSPSPSDRIRIPSVRVKQGAAIEVDRRDGGIAVFIVDAVEVYQARNFPDEKVCGASARSELRWSRVAGLLTEHR
jgi:hypothetical protein